MLNGEELQKFYKTHKIIDDSKMPSPENVASFLKSPELDKLFEKRL